MGLSTWIFLALASTLTVEGLVTINAGDSTRYGFVVDYEQNQFLLDGSPFRYVSGSFHYFRTPRVYWRDRLRKLRAAGLNAVSTYVEWSLHEPRPRQWNWEHEADLEYFLTLAQEEDLYVLLRPGPYICAERDLGGLPVWLLNLVPRNRLRTSDTCYMSYVATYINELMRRVKPFLRGNGGPVIMVQVENEYGSYYACDLNYTSQVRDLLSHHVRNDALLYTTDGDLDNLLRCGMVPGVYTTVDFGVEANVAESFATMRLFQPRGPFVNSEFYSGWLTYWDAPYQRVNASSVTRKLDEILSLGASVNIYMFYGGTNFGFTSGADLGQQYQPQITSYDYDAPITEAGDLTQKYFDIKNVVAKYLPIPDIALPLPSPKGDYGTVQMQSCLNLFDPEVRNNLGVSKLMQDTPLTFESFGFPVALVLYEATLPINRPDPSVLSVSSVHDRALVYEDDEFLGTLSRMDEIKSIPLSNPYGRDLKILVENQGHVNFGNELHDFKGLENVTVNGLPLPKWNVTAFQLSDLRRFSNLTAIRSNKILNHTPLMLSGQFTVPDIPLDTFLDTTGWGKGIAYINGHTLGRYWPAVGPQMTLYVPKTYLQTGENFILLLELEYVSESMQLSFQTVPNMSTIRRS